jgi:predicted NUDIX family phosphoesterase
MEVVERVLVLPRGRVPGGCDFTGLRTADEAALGAMGEAVASHGRFLDRPIAEANPAFKQLIPYVVVRQGELVFLMERSDGGGDPRLHRKASIGVGGHLNPVDGGADPLDAGLRREWSEELIADWEPRFRLIGTLNDDSNPVGSVHLGIVFEVDAAGRELAVRERDKLSGRWADSATLVAAGARLETWSRLVAEHLGLLPLVVESPAP